MLESQTLLWSLLPLLLLKRTSAAAPASEDYNIELSHERQLSQEKFFSYEPLTTVTDDAAIDLDQKLLESLLAEKTDTYEQLAYGVYTKGAFSKSYSVLTLQSPTTLPVDVAKGTDVFGTTADGKSVRGKLIKAAKQGDSNLEVQYHASPVQELWTNCHVGGNPDPNTEGCFALTGSIEVGELGEFNYSYNVTTETFNGRSLQGFSTKAKEKMYECDEGCPYHTYNKFFEYYGVHDYANQWVLAAFNRASTNFAKGNAAFNDYGFDGANEAIKKGTAYMNTWMYVTRELEHAANVCEGIKDCDGDDCSNDDPVHAWDKAVAFYMGSEAKQQGDSGYSLYTLAQKRCPDFGTCLDAGSESGVAKLNSDIFSHFRSGTQSLLMGNCVTTRFFVERISELMAVPLVQGTLRYAHSSDRSEKSEAEGATFAAAVLPLLNACSKEDAAIVYFNMRAGRGGTPADFKAVKDAFQRHYGCLGIECSDVGGLLDVMSGGYVDGAEPCRGNSNIPTTSNGNETGGGNGANVKAAIGWTLGFVALCAISAAVVARRAAGDKEFDGPFDADEDVDAEVVSFHGTHEQPSLWKEQPNEEEIVDI